MILAGNPLKGRELESLKAFLRRMDLDYEEGIEYSVCILNEEYEIVAAGSVERNVIKCVAVDPACQGQGYSAMILTQLIQYEFEQARTHIMIYTKPKNYDMFADMGFYTILKTEDILFMENQRYGLSRYLEQIKKETPKEAFHPEKINGAIVANCNPFTLGHRYLIEEALKRCDYLHLFLLSEDRSEFSARQRYDMVKLGIQDLDRVVLHQTSDYMISAATFPTYFFKDKAKGKKANCRLDLELFGKKIAPQLQISGRFVGTEPFCPVTRAYNEAMKELLPPLGIQVHEMVRKRSCDGPVSASEVRRCLEEKNYQRVKELVPQAVYEYMMEQCERSIY